VRPIKIGSQTNATLKVPNSNSLAAHKNKKRLSHLSPDLDVVNGDNQSDNYGGPSPLSPVELDDNDIQSLNIDSVSAARGEEIMNVDQYGLLN